MGENELTFSRRLIIEPLTPQLNLATQFCVSCMCSTRVEPVHAARVAVREQPLGQRVGAVQLRGDQQQTVCHVGGDLRV